MLHPPPTPPSTAQSSKPSKTPKLNNPINRLIMDSVMHNEDLVKEILVWLPAKSLSKFKIVCKMWLSIMSSNQFANQHTLMRLRYPLKLQQSLILQTDVPQWVYPENPQWFYLNPNTGRMIAYPLTLPSQRNHIIIQSCNGLLLLKTGTHRALSCFRVYNPATRQSREINLTDGRNHPRVVEVGLAFNPSKSPHYELVIVRSSLDTYRYKIEVYNSGSQAWKELSLQPLRYPEVKSLSPQGMRLYWNNAIYWSSNIGRGYCCFDIASGEMKTLAYPTSEGGVGGEVYRRLQESNGHLFHVELRGGDGCEIVKVWELGGDDEWILKQYHAIASTAASWACPSILTLFADTWSLLICRDEKIRVYSFIDGGYEDFAHVRGQPFFQDKGRRYCLMGFQIGETFALA